MTSLLSQFVRSAAAAEKPAPAKTKNTEKNAAGRKKGGETRSLRVQSRYAEVFAKPTTVAKASAEMDLSHVGCLNQCYRYERRGLLLRLAERDQQTGALLFQWNTK